MTIEETREKILTDDEFVVAEALKLQYLRDLKYVIRNNLVREEQLKTESVAEHTYGLNILARYFLPLEDKQNEMDHGKVFSIITWHDSDELETGDVVTWEKTDEIKESQKDTIKTVIGKAPDLLSKEILELFEEYDQKASLEARFVKALDKIDPYIEEYNEHGKIICNNHQLTRALHDSYKDHHVQDFPYIKRFHEVMGDVFEREGFFVPEM